MNIEALTNILVSKYRDEIYHEAYNSIAAQNPSLEEVEEKAQALATEIRDLIKKLL